MFCGLPLESMHNIMIHRLGSSHNRLNLSGICFFPFLLNSPRPFPKTITHQPQIATIVFPPPTTFPKAPILAVLILTTDMIVINPTSMTNRGVLDGLAVGAV